MNAPEKFFAGVLVEPGVEPVAVCCYCETESTADVFGRHRWTVQAGKDVCPACSPDAPAIPEKMRTLARMVAAKRPTPAQVALLVRDVARETGFPVKMVRRVFETALREGGKR